MKCSNNQKEILKILGREMGKEIKMVCIRIRNKINLITQIPYRIDMIFKNIIILVANVIIQAKKIIIRSLGIKMRRL